MITRLLRRVITHACVDRTSTGRFNSRAATELPNTLDACVNGNDSAVNGTAPSTVRDPNSDRVKREPGYVDSQLASAIASTIMFGPESYPAANGERLRGHMVSSLWSWSEL